MRSGSLCASVNHCSLTVTNCWRLNATSGRPPALRAVARSCVQPFQLPPLKLLFSPFVLRQGKEIIEFYLKELEEEGIEHVPRWAPSCLPQAVPRPSSFCSSPPLLPKDASTPSVPASQPSDSKDAASPDGAAAQADSLADVSAATAEGVFGRVSRPRVSRPRVSRPRASQPRCR